MRTDAEHADDGPINGSVRTHFRTCPLCEAMCGLEIQTEGDRVTRVRGDRDDVWSKGYLCPKGSALGHLHHDPDRLRVPMVREGDQWREVVVGRGVRPLRGAAAAGRRGARHRRGHRVHRQPVGPQLLAQPLHGCGRRHPAHARHLVGGHGRPVAEEPRVRAAVRQRVEHPDPRRPAHRPLRRDGREPARVAGIAVLVPRHHGRDRAHPRARRAHDRRRPAPHGHRRAGRRVDPDHPGHGRRLPARDRQRARRRGPGRTSARSPGACRASRRCSPRRATSPPRPSTDACGVPAERIRELARELAATERAVVYGRIGLCNQEFGTLASWAVDVVNVLTGHLDVEGGAMFPTPAIATISQTARRRGPGEHRTVAHPGAQRPRGAGPGAAVVPGRGDRHAGRGPGARADHDGRATPCCRHPTPAGSTRRCPCSTR